MILFEGIYSWDGKRKGAELPVSWWPGSYKIKIIDLKAKFPGVILLKPYLCIFSCEGTEFSVKDKFHNLALKICKKYKIDPEKIMWVEKHSGDNNKTTDVAIVESYTKIGKEKIYKTTWRQVRPNEENYILQAVTKSDSLAT